MKNRMNKKLIGLALGALLVALGFPAHAQQPGKIPRIGFLDTSTALGSAVLVEAFRQDLGKLGWIEGKTSAPNTGLQRTKVSSACLN
jgi:hypothetical protein